MRQQTQETGMRKEVIIASTVGLLCMLELCAPTEVDLSDMVEVPPYLLFATTVHIHRMNLDGSGMEVLVYEPNFGILGLEYHYRLNLLFWTNVVEPSIKQANLDGSNVRTIVTNGPGDLELDYPVDLALDWINDKLYWTDRDIRKIGAYDLVTGERRVILSTGDNSLPFGLAVYPFPDYGWLYWADRGKETLEVAAITGEGREVLESGRRVNCAWPLTLDYSEHTIYWINYCDQRMLSLNMDGSQSSQSVHVRNIAFSNSISVFNDTIFWTQHLSAYSADILQRQPVTHILQTSSRDGGARAIAAVHPMQQPTAEVFRMIVDTGTAVCDPPCANGDCIDPGLCYCDHGWTGLDCLTALATPSPSFAISSSLTATKTSADTVFSFELPKPQQSSVPSTPRQSSIQFTPRQISVPSTPLHSSISPTSQKSSTPFTSRQSFTPSTPQQSSNLPTSQQSSISSTPRQSSILSTPQQSSVLRQSSISPSVRTTLPITLLPSSKITTSSVEPSPITQSEEASASIIITKNSTYFDTATTTLIATSSLAELTSSTVLPQGTSKQTTNIIPSRSTPVMTIQSGTSPPNPRTLILQIPLQSSPIPMLPSSVSVGDTPGSSSIMLTLTTPKMSMDSSPHSGANRPESSGFTLAVVIAAVFAGVLLLTAVVVIIICTVAVLRQRAHKSRSWTPPRSAGDLPMAPLQVKGSVTVTSVVKEAL